MIEELEDSLLIPNFKKRQQEAILLITFGSSFTKPNESYKSLLKFFQEAFPQRDVFLSFNSKICIERWFAKTGERYYSPEEYLHTLGNYAYEKVLIQSLHITASSVFQQIECKYLPRFAEEYPHIPYALGRPLLANDDDIHYLGDVLCNIFAEPLSRGEAVCFIGHGDSSFGVEEANRQYQLLNDYLQKQYKHTAVATMDYSELSYNTMEHYLEAECPSVKVVHLTPLMSIVGKHALYDLTGELVEGLSPDEQSWRARLIQRGYICNEEHCHKRGLAEYEVVCQLWLNHLLEAEKHCL